MGRRTVLLIAAVVVAAFGTVLVFLYAQRADTNARAGQSLVTVLVAKADIAVGTSGATASSNGAFEQQQVPTANVVTGALSDATPLANLVAVVPIFPGQQIISQQWAATAQTAGLSLPPGTLAMQVQLGDPERVAGFVTPGSFVAIFTTGQQKGAGATGGVPTARVLLPKIQVLAVGPATAVAAATGSTSSATEQIPPAILTLAVTQDQFQKILFVTKTPGASYSGLTFGLLDKNSKVDPVNQGATDTNLFK